MFTPDEPRKAAVLQGDEDGIARAAAILSAGGLVAFPTETVYGLGADARNDAAVAGIFAAKDRPSFNPLIVHVTDAAAAEALAVADDPARTLMERFWPGPLTLVLPLRPRAGIAPLATAGLSTIAIRVPRADLARALLRAAARPIAAPSANPSGRVSPTEARHVLQGLGGRIDAILDGGPCPVGIESTIVSVDGDDIRLLRPGGLATETLKEALGREIGRPAGPTVAAPGQLPSHYAPKGRVRLEADAPREGEAFLGFGDVGGAGPNLSRSGDLAEAAANLFRHLHALDAEGAERIAVAPVPHHGLGRAINDRLRRAAAPRGDLSD